MSRTTARRTPGAGDGITTRPSWGRRTRRCGLALVLASTLATAGCTNDGPTSLDDEYSTLTIGQVSRPQPVEFEPYFDEVSIAGQTYTLPIPLQQLLDAGWVVHDRDHAEYADGWVKPFYSIRATLVRADDPNAYAEHRSIDVTIINTTPYTDTAENCDVWGVRIAEGFGTEPYPGVHAGASETEVATALNVSHDIVMGVDGDSRFNIFRETLSAEERLDLSAGSSSRSGTNPIRLAKVTVPFTDGMATGAYEVRYAPHTAMTDGYVTVPGWRMPGSSNLRCSSLPYTWLLPGDLSSEPTIVEGRQILGLDWIWSFVPDGGVSDTDKTLIDGGATYSIDGHDYAMAAANIPVCTEITNTSSATAAPTPEDLVFAELENATTVDTAPQEALLWEGERSSAGVLIYHGPGPSTGHDTMQVVVNYCDWEHGTHLTFLYSLLALEPDTEISDGAANLLLTVASDATRSITYTASS